jgi:hypothetical protein
MSVHEWTSLGAGIIGGIVLILWLPHPKGDLRGELVWHALLFGGVAEITYLTYIIFYRISVLISN